MEKKQKSFVQGAALLGAAGLIVKIIGAIFRIPFANAVGPEGACYYDAAYPYYSFLLVISSSGLPTAISKQVSERVALGDHAGADGFAADHVEGGVDTEHDAAASDIAGARDDPARVDCFRFADGCFEARALAGFEAYPATVSQEAIG